MLGPKIEQLTSSIGTDMEPTWLSDIDPEYFSVLNKLGNTAIHTNDGDISLQNSFDQDLFDSVSITLQYLLDLIYEAPKRKAERLNALRAALPKKSS